MITAKSVDGSEFITTNGKTVIRSSTGGKVVKVMFMEGQSSIMQGWERLGCKGDGETGRCREGSTKGNQKASSISGGKDRAVVDSSKKRSFVLAGCCFRRRAHRGGTGARQDLGDISAIGSAVRENPEAKRWVGALDLDSDVAFGQERSEMETKRSDGSRHSVSGDRIAGLHAMEVLYVGWDGLEREVIHTFIKAGVESNFDAFGINIKPQYVFEGVRQISQENSLASMIGEASGTLAGRANPDSTTKRSELGEVGFRVMESLIGRGLVVLGKGILEPKKRLESIGPKSRIEVSAVQHGTEGVTNSLVGPFDGAILVGCIGTSWIYIVEEFLFKKITDSRVVVEFTTLI
jgi:hypothetical protein